MAQSVGERVKTQVQDESNESMKEVLNKQSSDSMCIDELKKVVGTKDKDLEAKDQEIERGADPKPAKPRAAAAASKS